MLAYKIAKKLLKKFIFRNNNTQLRCQSGKTKYLDSFYKISFELLKLGIYPTNNIAVQSQISGATHRNYRLQRHANHDAGGSNKGFSCMYAQQDGQLNLSIRKYEL